MSLLFDPLYPTQVQYVVSQPIWELYEIHFWNLLVGKWGKNRVLPILRQRYEKKRYEGPVVVFLVFVFLITYLIEWYMSRKPIPIVPEGDEHQNNVADHQNEENVENNERVDNQEEGDPIDDEDEQ